MVYIWVKPPNPFPAATRFLFHHSITYPVFVYSLVYRVYWASFSS